MNSEEVISVSWSKAVTLHESHFFNIFIFPCISFKDQFAFLAVLYWLHEKSDES